MEYALKHKRKAVSAELGLLSQCSLLRHLPAEQMEPLLNRVQERAAAAGEVMFRTGDPGDALYIVARGGVEVINDDNGQTWPN